MPVPDAQDAVAEIRRVEQLEGVRRRRLIIGSSSGLLLILVVAAVVATVSTTPAHSPDNASASSGNVRTSSKTIETFCSPTEYKDTCKSSLSGALKSEDPDPQELFKAVVSVIFDEVGVAFNKTQQVFQTEDPRVKGAAEDCKELFLSCKDELQNSLNAIIDKGMDDLHESTNDIRIWLSAVMAYQQTCVDGFPEDDDGDLKRKVVVEELRRMKELTSNGLVIIRKASEYLNMLSMDGLVGRRRLLEENQEEVLMDGGRVFPTWMSGGERRLLDEDYDDGISLKPDVTVAKDGSGQFTSIMAALKALPPDRKDRYIRAQVEVLFLHILNHV